MPECFNKLLTSSAVQRYDIYIKRMEAYADAVHYELPCHDRNINLNRWPADVQDGIYDMLVLFIDLIVTRLKYDPLPLSMLNLLGMVYTVYL